MSEDEKTQAEGTTPADVAGAAAEGAAEGATPTEGQDSGQQEDTGSGSEDEAPAGE